MKHSPRGGRNRKERRGAGITTLDDSMMKSVDLSVGRGERTLRGEMSLEEAFKNDAICQFHYFLLPTEDAPHYLHR